MPNLKPEKRMNKNGVLVTKHVRVDKNESSSKSVIPAPTQPATSDAPTQKPGRFMTPEDFRTLSKALDLCSGSQDNLSHLQVHIQAGDMRAIRVFATHQDEDYGHLQDVIYAVDSWYGKDEDMANSPSFLAHIKLAHHIMYYELDDDTTRIVKMAHENPESIDEIIEFLEDRSEDPDELEEYLNNTVVALRKGSL